MSRVMKPVPASRPAAEPAPPPHPLAGTTMSGADAILQVLADHLEIGIQVLDDRVRL